MYRRITVAALAATLTLGLMGAAAARTGSTPAENGCPASAEERPVGDFEGYAMPGILDAAGNGDGHICAFALPEAAAKNTPVEVVYQFFENDLTPGH